MIVSSLNTHDQTKMSSLFKGIRLPGFLIIALLLSAPSFCQEKDLGAILKTQSDTLQVKRLLEYAHGIRDKDQIESERIYKMAIEQSIRLHYNNGARSGWQAIGFLYGQAGDFNKCIDYFRLAEAIIKREIKAMNGRFEWRVLRARG